MVHYFRDKKQLKTMSVGDIGVIGDRAFKMLENGELSPFPAPNDIRITLLFNITEAAFMLLYTITKDSLKFSLIKIFNRWLKLGKEFYIEMEKMRGTTVRAFTDNSENGKEIDTADALEKGSETAIEIFGWMDKVFCEFYPDGLTKTK